MHMKNEQGEKLFSFSGSGRCYDKFHEAGEYEQTCIIPANFLNWGNFALDLLAFKRENNIIPLAEENDIISFSLASRKVAIGSFMGKEPGYITPKFDFTEEKL